MDGYRYDPTKNPDERSLPGVPLADLSAEFVAEQPEWLQRSIAACPYYVPQGVAAVKQQRSTLPRPNETKTTEAEASS